MSTSNGIPVTDASLRDWGASFVAQLEAAPGPQTFGLDDAEASAFVDAFTAYNAAYVKAKAEATRGPLATREKNTARDFFRKTARTTVAIVQAYPNTTDNMRQALQIPIRDKDRTPVDPPDTTPRLQIISVQGHVVKLQVLDENNKKRKPRYVSGYNLFMYVGDTAPNDIAAWKFVAGYNKLDNELTLPLTLPVGSKVWLTCCWINRKLEAGEACTPIMTGPTFGGLSQAA